ncbi:TPA: hypothetical protein ACOEGC_003991 [Enterobacter kobei]
MKQKFIEWFTKNNNGCSPAMEDDRSFVYEMTQHMFEAYQAGVAEGEARCATLAAELRAVEAIHDEAVFITDDHYEQCPPEVQKMIRSLAVLQIPAYQAFLTEVRAQVVEAFLRDSQLPYQIATVLADYDNVDDATLQTVIWSGQPPEPDGDVWHLEYVSRGNAIVRAVLKEIRKGVQS